MKRNTKWFIVLMVMIFSMSMFIACKPATLDSTDIEYDGEYITWKEVSGAQHYLLSINGGQDEKLTGTAFQHTITETFTVKLTAVLKKEELVAEKTFTLIDQVQNVRIEDGVVLWDEVVEADSYTVMINSVKVASAAQTHFTLRQSDVGNLSIKVMATKGSSYFSKWSTTLSVNILAAPQNIVFDGAIISWNPVAGATSYNVVVNNGDPLSTGSTNMPFDAKQQDVKIKVQAAGSAANVIASKFSEEVEYFFLAPITTLQVVDGILTWQAIDNATAYEVKIGNNTTTVTECSYADFTPGTSYSVQVKPTATGKNYFSEWSVAKSIMILRAPIIDYNSGNIVWSGISNAKSYSLVHTINGVPQTTLSVGTVGSTTYSLAERLETAGTYTFRLRANSDEEPYYNSQLSNTITIIRLDKPSTYSVSDDPYQTFSTTVSISSVPNATGYDILSDDVAIEEASGTIFKVGKSEKTLPADENEMVKISIRSKGSTNAISDGSNKTYVLDSIVTLDFELTRLATPRNIQINNGRVVWDTVTKAQGYIVSIGGGDAMDIPSGNGFDLPELSAGVHNITVRAKGNGSDVLSSPYSTPKPVRKLDTPTNVSFTSANMLTWTPVNQAVSYVVKIGTEEIPTSIASQTIEASKIVNGVGINIVAMGNTGDIIDSDLSMPLMVTRLSAPTNISVLDDNIIWNAPPEATNKNVTYVVKVGNFPQSNSYVSTPVWSGSNLAEGSHAISVIAYGDNRTLFDSEYSAVVNITKLGKVTPVIDPDDKAYIKFDDVLNASEAAGYAVSVGSSGWQSVVDNKIKISDFVSSVGKHTFNIKTRGSNVKNSLDSAVATIEVTAALLSTVTDYSHSYDPDTRKLTITIGTYTSLLDNQKFVVVVDGTHHAMEEKSFTMDIQVGATITYSVYAQGGLVGSDGKFYLNSGTSTERKLSFLQPPVLLDPSKSGSVLTLKWSASTSATTYEYEITLKDTNGVQLDKITGNTSSLQLPVSFGSAVTVEFKIRAKGNTSTFPSEWREQTYYL